jgi:hypothetical protein
MGGCALLEEGEHLVGEDPLHDGVCVDDAVGHQLLEGDDDVLWRVLPELAHRRRHRQARLHGAGQATQEGVIPVPRQRTNGNPTRQQSPAPPLIDGWAVVVVVVKATRLIACAVVCACAVARARVRQ